MSIPMTGAAVAARYKNVQVQTASPAQVVLMLLEGVLRFAREADAAMERSDRARAGERIGRCHAVLEELLATLDAEQAPELCDNLAGVYTFCMGRLLAANLSQDRATLAEVVRVIEPLRDAWRQVSTPSTSAR